jgi:hypothetical protein
MKITPSIRRVSVLCDEEINKLNRDRFNGKLPYSKASEEFAINYRNMREYIAKKNIGDKGSDKLL